MGHPARPPRPYHPPSNIIPSVLSVQHQGIMSGDRHNGAPTSTTTATISHPPRATFAVPPSDPNIDRPLSTHQLLAGADDHVPWLNSHQLPDEMQMQQQPTTRRSEDNSSMLSHHGSTSRRTVNWHCGPAVAATPLGDWLTRRMAMPSSGLPIAMKLGSLRHDRLGEEAWHRPQQSRSREAR